VLPPLCRTRTTSFLTNPSLLADHDPAIPRHGALDASECRSTLRQVIVCACIQIVDCDASLPTLSHLRSTFAGCSAAVGRRRFLNSRHVAQGE
jgi:hypothetical protein